VGYNYVADNMGLHCVHEKTITLDNVRKKCQIWTHPNQIACAWLWIYLRQNCQIS